MNKGAKRSLYFIGFLILLYILQQVGLLADIISYLGAFGGGLNVIPFGWDFLVIGIFSVISLWGAVISRAKLSPEEVAEYLFAESQTV